jgi:DNA-binding LacI/PurR family transcriptional regulator
MDRIDISEIQNHPQTVKAYRMILRYMRSRNVQPGDMVPKQPELQQVVNFSNNTLIKAMKWLVQDGVLERRQRAGTVLLDMSKARLQTHTVALAMVPHTILTDEPFYSHWLRAIEGYIRQILGAQVRIFGQQIDKRQSKVWPMSTFPELEDLIEQGEIDAVFCPIAVDSRTTTVFRKIGVPWLHVGSSELEQCGVVIDQQPFVRKACRMLRDRGCRRLQIVSIDQPQKGHDRYWSVYQQVVSEYGLPVEPIIHAADVLISVNNRTLEAGRRLARLLLNRQSDQRPDGLIILNDMLATGMTDVLREQRDYQPDIAVQANIPSAMIFGIPVIRFDVDIYKMAQQAVKQLQSIWTQPSEQAGLHWYAPYMAHEMAIDMQIPAEIIAI